MGKTEGKSWGGAREGAGRKKKYAATYSFGAYADVAAILDEQGKERTEYINAAIRACSAKK